MKMFQCTLRQSNAIEIAWIEARGAKAGAFVEISALGGLWRVEQVGSIGIDADWLREKQRVDRKGMPDI